MKLYDLPRSRSSLDTSVPLDHDLTTPVCLTAFDVPVLLEVLADFLARPLGILLLLANGRLRLLAFHVGLPVLELAELLAEPAALQLPAVLLLFLARRLLRARLRQQRRRSAPQRAQIYSSFKQALYLTVYCVRLQNLRVNFPR